MIAWAGVALIRVWENRNISMAREWGQEKLAESKSFSPMCSTIAWGFSSDRVSMCDSAFSRERPGEPYRNTPVLD